jgi:hypothetical protein
LLSQKQKRKKAKKKKPDKNKTGQSEIRVTVMASSRLTRRRQGSVPKSDSPDGADVEHVSVVGNVKNNNVAKRDFRLEDLGSILRNSILAEKLFICKFWTHFHPKNN